MLTNRIAEVDVVGEHESGTEVSIRAHPRSGWKGSIRHLRLKFTDFTLRGVPLTSFVADIPSVKYDITRAMFRHDLVVRSAGLGPASIKIGARGMQTFLAKKFSRILGDPVIAFDNGSVVVNAKLLLFALPQPFYARGGLTVADHRYLRIVPQEMRINGLLITGPAEASILKQLNPVVDNDEDLGLRGVFIPDSVAIGRDGVTVTGESTIPIEESAGATRR